MAKWQHPYFTDGQLVTLKPLNIKALKALAQKRVELKTNGTDDSIGNFEVFEVLAFHTIRAFRPATTEAEIGEHMDHTEMQAFVDAISDTNGFNKKKAVEPAGDFPKPAA